jgi:hypothetical protein
MNSVKIWIHYGFRKIKSKNISSTKNNGISEIAVFR